MKYWGFYLPKHISRFAEVNAPLSNKIKEDIRRWNSVSFLSLSHRIDCVKMNILLLYLYLFQALPMEITQKEFSAINNLTRILKKDGKRKETSQYQMKNGWMHVNPCGVEMYKFQYMAPKQMAHLDIGALKCWRMCREVLIAAAKKAVTRCWLLPRPPL